jgi:hypothetical protein
MMIAECAEAGAQVRAGERHGAAGEFARRGVKTDVAECIFEDGDSDEDDDDNDDCWTR